MASHPVVPVFVEVQKAYEFMAVEKVNGPVVATGTGAMVYVPLKYVGHHCCVILGGGEYVDHWPSLAGRKRLKLKGLLPDDVLFKFCVAQSSSSACVYLPRECIGNRATVFILEKGADV